MKEIKSYSNPNHKWYDERTLISYKGDHDDEICKGVHNWEIVMKGNCYLKKKCTLCDGIYERDSSD